MNKDQLKGRGKQVVGKVKETAGKMTGDRDLEIEGKVEKTVGKVQSAYGDIKQDFKKKI